jgi:hypothetical protein
VVDGQMRLNDAGRLEEWTWQDLPNHVSNTKVAFVVITNHVHGIIVTVVGAGSEPAPTKPAPTERYGLPEMVRQFKTFSARHITHIAAPQASPSGNATITNTTSAMRCCSTVSADTSSITCSAGHPTVKTHQQSPYNRDIYGKYD